MDSVGKRLLYLMQVYELNKGEFAERLQISPGVISHISSGRNKPGLEMVVQCLLVFPEISADWLLLGKGAMKREGADKDQLQQLDKLLDEIKLLNDMNYNSLSTRLELLKKHISG